MDGTYTYTSSILINFARYHDNNDMPTPQHSCNINYDGPSTGMEAHLIVQGFQSNEELYGARYNKLTADGDSCVYKRILDARPYVNTYTC